MRLTILGSGTSFGVPQIGCRCAVCGSGDPRDRRTRTAGVVQAGDRTLLIDTPPEIRLQLLGAKVVRVDAVLYTHEHADHTHGIDDLRAFTIRGGPALPAFGPVETLRHLQRAFGYIFDLGHPVPEGTSIPRLALHPVQSGQPFAAAGFEVFPMAFSHGASTVYGYRIGPVAYVTDVKQVTGDALAALQGVRVLVLSALWWREHPTHQSIPEAVEAARAIGAERTYLTHLSHETGHADLLSRLPEGIEPAWDGLTVEVGE